MINSLFFFVPIACFLYVVHNVWTKRDDLSTTSKVIWSILAIFFNVLTWVIYLVTKPKDA